MTEFEKAVVAEVKRVREILARNEDLTSFNLGLEASGRVHDGEVQIKFSLGTYGSEVSGNSVDAVVREYMRRKGFNAQNNGLLLSGPGDVTEA